MADIVKTVKNEMTFEKILATAMHTPGVKINREKVSSKGTDKILLRRYYC